MKTTNNYMKLSTIFILIVLISLPIHSRAQEVCPPETTDNGAIRLLLDPPSLATIFTGALLGTKERISGKTSGGMNWLHTDNESFATSSTGAQLIGWWNQKGNSNTTLQVRNSSLSFPVSVHINIFDENCLEIRDYCDTFTPGDIHTYDLSYLVTNTGATIFAGNLDNKEGFLTVTAVADCGADNRAIGFPLLEGDLKITENSRNYQYGAKMWARDNDTMFDCTLTIPSGHNILDNVGDCKLRTIRPNTLDTVFSTVPGSNQRNADLVVIAFSESYTPFYQPLPGTMAIAPPIMYDTDENANLCPNYLVTCFDRKGLNDVLSINTPPDTPGGGPPPGAGPPGGGGPPGPPFPPPGPPPSVGPPSGPLGPPFIPPGRR